MTQHIKEKNGGKMVVVLKKGVKNLSKRAYKNTKKVKEIIIIENN